MNWDQATQWLERAKSALQVLSILGPYVIWPALLVLVRVASRLRQLYIAAPKILRALAIFGNRERRAFDVDRRLLFYQRRLIDRHRRLIGIVRFEAKRLGYSAETQAVLEMAYQDLGQMDLDLATLDKDIQELRQTGFRAREVQKQRELRDQQIRAQGKSAIRIDQGELDATAVGPIERVLGK